MKTRILTSVICLTMTLSSLIARETYNFNPDWCFAIGDNPQAATVDFDDTQWYRVTLPHAWNEDEAFKVLIDSLSDTIVWYRKHFVLPETKDTKYFLEVEGVRQAGEFYVNGMKVGLHENGVTAFGFDISAYVHAGANVIAVRTDNDWAYREKSTNSKFQWNDHNFNANYGGLPKNIYLHCTGKIYQTLPLYSNLRTTGTYIFARDFDIPAHKATIHAESEVSNETNADQSVTYRVTLIDRDGTTLNTWQSAPQTISAGRKATLSAEAPCTNLHFWSWGYGYLYDVRTELLIDNAVVDAVTTRTGFRKTRFAEGKIWLNDRVIMMHGYAQRTSNEWPALGMSVPAWLSDYSNALLVESGGNLVRWMHTCPWKQDVESCDRVGLIQAMPAGDAEKDREGKQWTQRTEAMRDAIIYNRNNPSILFYESGNAGISEAHMLEMKAIRDKYDPYGGRAIGSREMLAINSAEYGGEMLYINKSHKHPMWQMEYCRDEGLRLYWDEYSYPFHPEGAGPLYRKKPAKEYNRNQDQFAIELIRRWYDYWLERPGRGKRVNGGGAKIVFSDTNTHCRGEENYRRSGVVDAMRIAKDGFYAHQVMWDGWVTPENDRTYIIGHWNYTDEVHKPVHVVSTGDKVELYLNGKRVEQEPQRSYNFLFTFLDIPFQAGKLEAISYRNNVEISRYAIETAGAPAALRLTPITNPLGFQADGADVALVEVEVIDKNGHRCPLDNRIIHWTVSGPAEYRGGIAKVFPIHERPEDNFILSPDLPVECGVNRVIIRSTTKTGKITVTAQAKGLKKQTITLNTQTVTNNGGLSSYLPARTLQGSLMRGETPSSPSYRDEVLGVDILSATSATNDSTLAASYDDNEYSFWQNDGQLATASVTYILSHKAAICDIALKLGDWKSRRYPLEVLADNQVVWSGLTDGSLGYVHLVIDHPVPATTYTIRMTGPAQKIDLSNQVGELAGGKTNKLEGGKTGKGTLKIIEVDFLERPQPKAIVSLTFDDGLLEHYTTVFPLLQELNLRATFWIIASHIDQAKALKGAQPMTWENVASMAAAGQEIANHTYSHRDPDKQSLAELKTDILAGDSAIFAHTGIHPTALAYPFNHHNEAQTAIATELSLIPRLTQQSFGGKRVSTEADFEAWLTKTLKSGGWTVTMTHGIASGYDALPNPALFETYLRRLAQLQTEGEILILPFSEAASYMQARM